MKYTKKEKEAVKEYMNNYSTPLEIADKYNIPIDRLRLLIDIEMQQEKIEAKKDFLFDDQIGNPFIDID